MTKVQRDKIIVGERPKVTSEVIDDTNIQYNWITSLLNKNLKYDLARCIGCSLCLPCPWDAITLGPVQEVASGRMESAPLILIDEDKCTFCGLCDSACIFNAIEAEFDDIPANVQYARLKGKHHLDEEKCAPCVLCAKICPRDAITVELKVTPKIELVHYKDPQVAQNVADGNPDAKGSIAIDEDKCTWCGLCELLCPECITIYWIEEKPKPPDFHPAVSIRVDTTHCDYCGLCEVICPSDAVNVTCKSSPAREINEPQIEGSMKIDDKLCVDCTLCAQKCPYEALEVTLPLTGIVEIQNLEKCDPTGCINCFKICPTQAIYPSGDKDKIAINEDICVFCGACENACPEQVLKVKRDSYSLSHLEKARDWERARARRFYDHLIGREAPRSDIYEREITVATSQDSTGGLSKPEHWNEEPMIRQVAQDRIRKLQSIIQKNWRLRLLFERGRVDPLCAAVRNEASEVLKVTARNVKGNSPSGSNKESKPRKSSTKHIKNT